MNNKTVHRSVTIIQYVRWQTSDSLNSGAAHALYIQDYQMHNNVYNTKIDFFVFLRYRLPMDDWRPYGIRW